jgi:hypothetical protein
MNEAAANVATLPASQAREARPTFNQKQRGLIGYGLLVIALSAGWLLRDVGLVDPSRGVGYWLGIVGGSLMLFLLLYPAGKKWKFMQRIGLTRHWFRIHIVLGLVGPLLVLYHCNFKLGSTNSTVALTSMLVVAVSGIIGKYFYARIHRGLHGRRATIEELRAEITDSLENSRGVAAILPGFCRELHAISDEVLGDRFTRKMNIRRSMLWSVKYHFVRLKLYIKIRRELRGRAMLSETIRTNSGELRRAALLYMNDQVRLMRRIAQLAFYERLFSIWHLFHMPLFLLLVLSALVHVLAVHMY